MRGVYCSNGRGVSATKGALVAVSMLICAAAQAQVAVSPLFIDDLSIYPGGLKTVTLAVTSTSKEVQACTVSISGMVVMEGGLPTPADDAPRSCKDWISMTPTSFTLPPGKGQRVQCQVRAPRNASGGYYAIVSCDAAEKKEVEPTTVEGIQAGIRFKYRNLVPILLTVPGSKLEALIEGGIPILSQQEGAGGYTIGLPLRNRGNVHARIRGTVEIQSEDLQLMEKLELMAGRGYLLPEQERFFQTKGNVNLADGVYLANFRLELDKSTRPMAKSFSFIVENGLPRVEEPSAELRAKLEAKTAGFIVVPSELTLTARPGGQSTGSVEVVNVSAAPVRVVCGLAEWQRSPTGVDAVSNDPPLHKRSGLAALTMLQPEFELPPRGRRRVPLSVSLPREAVGEGYAAVSFDRPDRKLDASPEMRRRRSAIVSVVAEGTGQRDAQITSLDAKRDATGVTTFTVRFRNTGSLRFSPQAIINIRREGANAILGKVNFPSAAPSVQAGGEGVITQEWREVLEPGTYSAELTLRFDDNLPPVATRVDFVVASASAQPEAKGTKPSA